MERFAWKAVVKDGMLAEYKKRHDNIWPELKQVLKDAGISNYTIWTPAFTLGITITIYINYKILFLL